MRFSIAASFLISLLSPNGRAAWTYEKSELTPFVSDGCTSFVNGDFAQPDRYLECCVAHDLHYWAGGTELQRAEADSNFYNCLVEKTQSRWLAGTMYRAVRLAGGPDTTKAYRWGFGWPIGRSYQALTANEKTWIRERYRDYPCRANLGQLTSNLSLVERICQGSES